MTTRSDNDNDVSVASVASVGESYYSSEGGERHQEKAQQTTAEDGVCCAVSSPLLHALAGISASGDGMKTRLTSSAQRLHSPSTSPSPSSSSSPSASAARDGEEMAPQRLSGRTLLRTLLPNLRDDEEEGASADERQRQQERPAKKSEDPPGLLETVVEATRRIEECVERLSRHVAGLEARLDEAILKEDDRHALCGRCSTRVDDDAVFSTPPRVKETAAPETNFCTTPSRLVRASPSPRLVDDFTKLYLVECCETEAE